MSTTQEQKSGRECLACKNDFVARGLCRICYDAAKARVDAGEVTWEELEKAKLTRPLGYGRRVSPMHAAIDALKSQQDQPNS